ncbi:MAG: sigma-70 family RNA polymerase sigma factor [Ignavibacterium sp.]|nr:MAG: sigma-70 family RNA polymerase sigma factor [Ignavibacterium sp.]
MDKNLNALSDEELISELQQTNNERAFEILVQRYKNPLTNFVFRFLGDFDACTDVVQETMIKVYRYKDNYSSVAKFSTWIYTIAGNLARTEYRRRKRRSYLSISDYGEDEKTFDIPDESYRPDVMTDTGIKDKIIQDALLKVKEVFREVVILRDIQGLSYEEISEITGLNEGTVKSRINRGRAKLQELLKDIYKE